MPFPSQVKIIEVGPRDGLQNEAQAATVEQRIELIRQLAKAGVKNIEAGSFISPRWVPQMANTAAVLKGLDMNRDIHYPVLVPNTRGMQDALTAGAREISIFAAASETFSQKNINCSIDQSIERFTEVAQLAQENKIRMRGYLSCVLGCPYEGDIDPKAVLDVAKKLIKLGCYEVSLGDTVGVGTPLQVQTLIKRLADQIGTDRIAVHFHDTYGQALANIFAALEMGVQVVDSAVAGLGGCPYANGASGNVASEDVVYMLNGMGIETGIDLKQLVIAGRYICTQLDRPVRSRVNQAFQI